jgi:transcriptional regulator with XRE-family HTH domain
MYCRNPHIEFVLGAASMAEENRMDLYAFGAKIVEYLRRKDMRQAVLARRIGCKPPNLTRWLNGERQIKYDQLGMVCRVLELDSVEQQELYNLAGYPLPAWVRHPAPAGADDSAANLPCVVRLPIYRDRLYAYVAERLDAVQESVWDLTWGIDRPSATVAHENAYARYIAKIPELCARDVEYREIMTFHNDPGHFLLRAEEMLSLQLTSYSLGYYDINLLNTPPLLTFIIFDRNEVLASNYEWPNTRSSGEYWLSIRHPDLIDLFRDYYERLWHAAKPIKEGTRIYLDVFEELKRKHAQ